MIDRPPSSTYQDWIWKLAGKNEPPVAKRLILVTTISVLFFWLVSTVLSGTSDLGFIWIGVSLLLAAAVTIAVEFYYVLITTHRITTLFTSQHWDLLRLTPLKREKLFADLYVYTQLRCWKLMDVESVVRIIPIELCALQLIAAFSVLIMTNGLDFRMITQIPLLCLSLIVILGILGFVLFVLMSEPRLRLAPIVAATIAFAAKIRDFPFTSLAGITTVTVLHLLQMAALYSLLQITTRLFFGEITWAWILSLIAIIPISARLYSDSRDWALDIAWRELFRPE